MTGSDVPPPVAGPGAGRPPDRRYELWTPVRIELAEWGEPSAPPLLLVHGGADSARTFDRLAALLAAEGHRAVAWDQRGHGESDHAALYSFTADVRDAAAVAVAVGGGGPLPIVGHSKGGVIAIELAVARPDLVACVVAIDGFVRRRFVDDGAPLAATRYLDRRRGGFAFRTGTRDELVERRAGSTPRLDRAAVEALVEGAAVPDGSGEWRWKLDPAAYPPAPSPATPAWSLRMLAATPVPLLALRAGVTEPVAGQPTARELRRHLPPGAQLAYLEGLGHFAHLEDPVAVAAALVPFVGAHRPGRSGASEGGATSSADAPGAREGSDHRADAREGHDDAGLGGDGAVTMPPPQGSRTV